MRIAELDSKCTRARVPYNLRLAWRKIRKSESIFMSRNSTLEPFAKPEDNKEIHSISLQIGLVRSGKVNVNLRAMKLKTLQHFALR